MWCVQALPDLVFELLPRYQSFQVKLKNAEVRGAFIAQRSRELTFDVAGGGERHGKRKGGVIDTVTARDRRPVPQFRRRTIIHPVVYE